MTGVLARREEGTGIHREEGHGMVETEWSVAAIAKERQKPPEEARKNSSL